MPKTQIFGYFVRYQGENSVGCIQSATEETARNQLRDQFHLPAHVEIDVKPLKFDETGLCELYYG